MSLVAATRLALNKKIEEENKNGIVAKPAFEKKVRYYNMFVSSKPYLRLAFNLVIVIALVAW